jgi:hydrogenase expression/formation protein HypD
MAEQLTETLRRLGEDAELAKGLIGRIRERVPKSLTFMEVCGTHTHAISRTGIRKALAGKVKLLSGPGCPVCVTPDEEIDAFISLAGMKDVVVTTFGDMLHVPGTNVSLADERDEGKDIRVVYSPLDVLDMAKKEKGKEFCFLGVGFETTSPTVLATVAEAKRQNIRNFSIYPSFKLIPPALRMIAGHPDLKIDGFLLPGHVSAIIGTEPYRFLVDEFRKPSVVAGFEALDILEAILMLAEDMSDVNLKLEIQYRRVVDAGGNKHALDLIEGMCERKDSVWRGLGMIPDTGLRLKNEWKEFDAAHKFGLATISYGDSGTSRGCRCGDVLLGKITPPECPLFATDCTPERAVGPCMVSSEGACAAYYKYER